MIKKPSSREFDSHLTVFFLIIIINYFVHTRYFKINIQNIYNIGMTTLQKAKLVTRVSELTKSRIYSSSYKV